MQAACRCPPVCEDAGVDRCDERDVAPVASIPDWGHPPSLERPAANRPVRLGLHTGECAAPLKSVPGIEAKLNKTVGKNR